MALEIERKWLIRADDIPDLTGTTLVNIEQAYVLDDDGVVLRVRSAIRHHDGVAVGFVTVKTPASLGVSHEYEMDIPYAAAITLISACSKKIVKTRHYIPWDGLMIELDIFYSVETKLPVLIIAEVEFPEQDMPFDVPHWFGREVTGVLGYSNASMIKHGLPLDFLGDSTYNTFSNNRGAVNMSTGKVIKLTNGDLAVELTPEHLEKAGLVVGDHVLWDPRKMGFSKYSGSSFDFPIGSAMFRIKCPTEPTFSPDYVQITFDMGDITFVGVVRREDFKIFADGIAELNKELSLISEIVRVQE